MRISSILPAILAASAIATWSPAQAADEYNVANGLTLSGLPLGMHGVDPVSMFAGTAPVLGDAAFTSEFDGVNYYFASAQAQATFDAQAADFLPQFGGFCAYGVYVGKKLDGDVRYADIVDGKLYLFVNAVIFKKYLADKDTVLAGADAKWPKIREAHIKDL